MPPREDLDRLAALLYNTWREPPSLTWEAIMLSAGAGADSGPGTAAFIRRWRRVAAVVLQTAEQMVGRTVLTRTDGP